jgi:hypothetical protein
MEELQRVIEANALFMDALGGEFQPIQDPNNTHSLARLVRNMLLERAEEPIEEGKIASEYKKTVNWASATTYLGCVPFEMRSFGRYGENGQVLLVPVRLGFLIEREDHGIKALKFESFHPETFSYDFQPEGPEGSFDSGGYIHVSATSYGPRGSEVTSIEQKVGLCEVKHGFKAREIVTELAKQAFC